MIYGKTLLWAGGGEGGGAVKTPPTQLEKTQQPPLQHQQGKAVDRAARSQTCCKLLGSTPRCVASCLRGSSQLPRPQALAKQLAGRGGGGRGEGHCYMREQVWGKAGGRQ